jgi:predicted N-acetyltransferase YhbS
VLHNTKPFREVLENGLILKSVNAEEDIEHLAAFNVAVHNEEQLDRMTRTLIVHHPSTHPQEWLFVEDPANGKIVSSLCLIPWSLRYENVQLKAAEMGIVGTLPEYRHRGLIRMLNSRYKQLLDVGEYDLSHIQGIPYYYRQFGYEYALPLEGGWELGLHTIPNEVPLYALEYAFQKATIDDIPMLDRFYNAAMSKLQLSTLRDDAIWHYLIQQEANLQGLQETWLVQNKNHESLGYVRIAKEGFGLGLIVDEASDLSHPATIAVLHWLKRMAIEREKPYIRLSMTETCPLISVARAWGVQIERLYAWQIKFPDPARLLWHISPVLEQRVENSPFAGITQSVILNLYRQAYELKFEKGHITAVNAIGFCDEANMIRIPPMQFIPLVLGYKSREELQAVYPDFSIRGQSQYLVDVLFPKMKSFLHLIY